MRAVESAVGVKIPDNARIIRNLLMGAQFQHDHIVHFYHLHALDWVDVVSALSADPAATAGIARQILPWPNNSATYFQEVQDRLKKYHEYRLLLQVLQSVDPAHRLTLKAPAHTDALEELLQTVPNALLIQTHRDPVTACNSINSLYYTTHRSVTQDLDVSRMAEASIRHLESMVVRNLAARDAHPSVVYDVYYERLVADPIGTVRGIYDHFGLNWSDAFQERLQAYVREYPRRKHGKHSYSSADFGQTDAAIAKRFAAYSERFGFTKEYARRKLQF